MVMTMIVLVLSACSTLAFAKENQSEGQPFKEIWEALSAIQFSTEGLLEAIQEAISGAVATLQATSSDAVAAVQASISDAVEAAQASISDAVSAVQSSIEASQGVVVGAVSGARDDVLDGVEDSRDAVIDEVESSRDMVIDEVESSRDSILAELADKPKIFAKTATCTLKKEGDWGEIRISSSAPFVVKAIYVIPDRDYNNQFDLRWPTWRWSGGALSARPGDWTWTFLPVWFDGVVYDPGAGIGSGFPFELIAEMDVERDELSFPGGWDLVASFDVEGITADTVLRVQVVLESAQTAAVSLSVTRPQY